MNSDQVEIQMPIVTVEERAKWEAGQDLPLFTKVRNVASDTFTPNQIKFLTTPGRINMGWYGVVALTFLLILTLMNGYALRNESYIVIGNSLLAFVVSLLALEKMIGSILHITKWFK